jgi:hypothetical protein
LSADRSLLLRWYTTLLGGLVPILVLGFLYSALADRLAFVYWALALAAAWVVVLRHGLGAGWPGARLAGALGLLLAAGLGGFAAIEKEHHEILDLGFRAVFPGAYHPLATQPATAAALAGLAALVGAAALLTHLVWKRRAR